MAEEKIRYIDNITSDVMYEVWGDSLEELLINAAIGMFRVMYSPEGHKFDQELDKRLNQES